MTFCAYSCTQYGLNFFSHFWVVRWNYPRPRLGLYEISLSHILYMLKVVNNTTRYKKNVYSRY